MPESFISSLDDRCSALDNFVENTVGTQSAHWNGIRAPSSIRNSYGRSQSAIADSDRLRAAICTPKVQDVDPPFPTSDSDIGRVTKSRGKRARENSEEPEKPQTVRKGSSIHYGVRFRPDLRKWVAEIRVKEWKDVDKKVWLGTFDTEDAAARGVDLARKLLKCAKKRPANLPCQELDLYSTNIPPHLDLTDIANDAMFKDVVLFVKNESQAYAARFSPTSTATLPVVAPQPQSTPNPTTLLDYEEVDVLWNDDNYELGLSDSELILPAPRSDHHSTPNVGMDDQVLIPTDFDLSEIFEEAFQLSDCSPGSSAPPSFTEFQFQYQLEANETARGASPLQRQAWETEMEMAVEPVCHDLADAAYLPQTWPGTSSPTGGPLQLPVNTGLPLEQSPMYISPGDGGDMAYWTFQMDMN